MTWMNGLRATFDLETTGVDVTTARIVTASLILLDPQGNVVRRGEWLADPGVEIPAGAAAVHGITTEYAREHGRPAREVCGSLPARLVRSILMVCRLLRSTLPTIFRCCTTRCYATILPTVSCRRVWCSTRMFCIST